MDMGGSAVPAFGAHVSHLLQLHIQSCHLPGFDFYRHFLRKIFESLNHGQAGFTEGQHQLKLAGIVEYRVATRAHPGIGIGGGVKFSIGGAQVNSVVSQGIVCRVQHPHL